MSLGSNCSVATALKLLNVREPGPFDWTNHFPLKDIFTNQSYADLILSHADYYLHEAVYSDKKQLNKVINRFKNLKDLKNIEFVFVGERNEECTLEQIEVLAKIIGDRPLHFIYSNSNATIPKTNFDKIKFYKDEGLIFDASVLDSNKSEIANWLKVNILKGDL